MKALFWPVDSLTVYCSASPLATCKVKQSFAFLLASGGSASTLSCSSRMSTRAALRGLRSNKVLETHVLVCLWSDGWRWFAIRGCNFHVGANIYGVWSHLSLIKNNVWHGLCTSSDNFKCVRVVFSFSFSFGFLKRNIDTPGNRNWNCFQLLDLDDVQKWAGDKKQQMAVLGKRSAICGFRHKYVEFQLHKISLPAPPPVGELQLLTINKTDRFLMWVSLEDY